VALQSAATVDNWQPTFSTLPGKAGGEDAVASREPRLQAADKSRYASGASGF
jgi:hypothetical protein